MATIELPENVVTNKVFWVQRSKLEGRLDASVYKNAFHFKSNSYPVLKLSEIAYINPSTTFKKLDNDDDEISFVPMEAIDDKSGTITKHYTKKVKDTNGFTRFKENDLIWAKITPCMQNGKSAIVANTLNGYACGSTEFFIIRPKNDEILVQYLHYLLRDKRVLDNAQNYFGGSAGQQRVSKEFLLNFQVPVPPLSVQKEITSIISDTNAKKKQIEIEAQGLLDSIDKYLLKELKISIPKIDNGLQNRIFTTLFSDAEGGRIDSHFFQRDFKEFFAEIYKGKYPVFPLKKISQVITSGITPLSGGDAYTDKNTGIPFIRSGNIHINGDLDFEDLLYLKEEVHNKLMKSSKVLYNDLMIAIVGATIGQVGIYKNDREANINQAIALVRLKPGLNIDFVKELIKSSIGQYNLNRLKRPVARANINLEEIASMQLIIPPIEKQNEIARHIQDIRNKAKRLQIEAQNIIEEARRTIEKMILN